MDLFKQLQYRIYMEAFVQNLHIEFLKLEFHHGFNSARYTLTNGKEIEYLSKDIYTCFFNKKS